MALPKTVNRALVATVGVTVTELYNEGRAAAVDPDAFPLAQISERMDERTCPLCQAVDGKSVRVGTEEYAEWRQPSHINCRRILEYVGKDEPAAADFQRPDAELIRKHGHYHVDPHAHAALRVPAEPAGRHFILRFVRNEETGAPERRLDWAPWWSRVPEQTRDAVLDARKASRKQLQDIFEQRLGLPREPRSWLASDWRRATELGVRDRAEGWITVSAKGPPGVPPAAAPLAQPSGPLSQLTPLQRKFLEDESFRATMMRSVQAGNAGDKQFVDETVEATMKAFGYGRAPVQDVVMEVADAQEYLAHKQWDCRIVLTNRALDDPNRGFRTWVHESAHGRERVDHLPDWQTRAWKSYGEYPGAEEGLVESVARAIARDAGVRNAGAAYGSYVEVYRSVADHWRLDEHDYLRAMYAVPRLDLNDRWAEATRDYLRSIGKTVSAAEWSALQGGRVELFAREVYFGKATERLDPAESRRRMTKYLQDGFPGWSL